MKNHWFLQVFRYPASWVILGSPGAMLRPLELPERPKRAQAPPQSPPGPPRSPKRLPDAPQELSYSQAHGAKTIVFTRVFVDFRFIVLCHF